MLSTSRLTATPRRAILALAILLSACTGKDYQVTSPPPPPPPPDDETHPPQPVLSAIWSGTLRLDIVPRTSDCVLEYFRTNPRIPATLEIRILESSATAYAEIISEHFGLQGQGADLVPSSSHLDLSTTAYSARFAERSDPLPIASGECEDARRKYGILALDLPPIESDGERFSIRGRTELVVVSMISRPMPIDTPMRFLDPQETSISGKVDLVRRLL